MYINIFIIRYTYINIFVCVNVCIHVRMYVCMYVVMCMHISLYLADNCKITRNCVTPHP